MEILESLIKLSGNPAFWAVCFGVGAVAANVVQWRMAVTKSKGFALERREWNVDRSNLVDDLIAAVKSGHVMSWDAEKTISRKPSYDERGVMNEYREKERRQRG